MVTVKLEFAEWKYDPDQQIGREGGFGTVFRRVDGDGHPVAVKKLKIEARDAAHRELAIAKDLRDRDLTHVIPVLDSGQDTDSDSYFVVMALAEKSLQDELDAGNTFDDIQAATIMADIAVGLSEVPGIVHRDLKPDNVLYHETRWKVADFGIARFVEASTSLQTLKASLTPQYAAPEQWNFDRATTATDTYALGCIGYALLTGRPPFPGQGHDQLKHQHLSQTPPLLDDHSPQFGALLLMMLRKLPETRPNLHRIQTVLKQISEPRAPTSAQEGLAALAQAGAQVATQEAKAEARRQAAKAELEQRQRLAKQARNMLTEIKNKLFDNICEAAPKAKRAQESVTLGQPARLWLRCVYADRFAEHSEFPKSKWDVLDGAVISVQQRTPQYQWSASLWYARLPTDDDYRWREVSYFRDPPLAGRKPVHEPFASKHLEHADEAAASMTGPYQIAFGPKPIDNEDFEDFCSRWADLLAKAANGKLSRPARFPLE